MTSSDSICRSMVILEWLEATESAISALDTWKRSLTRWHDGAPVEPHEVQAALALLEQAGLAEWVEWGAGLSLDVLAAAVTEGKLPRGSRAQEG